jgi:SAM-dependent methyltransferase
MLKQSEIDDIYKKFIAPKNNEAYLNKYANYDFTQNLKSWSWEGKDFPRVIALLEFAEFIKDYKFKNAVSFNGLNDPEWEYINTEKKRDFDHFDDMDKHDLHLPFAIPSLCDFFMTNQTLEHCISPALALQNIYNQMAQNGICFINVPALNIPHEIGMHYYAGITPLGLGCLFKQAGFELLDIGFWGSLEYINFIFNHKHWPDYRQLSRHGNEFENPCITWAMGIKTSRV